ncbi:anti-phage dCTP deaminase [Roseiarcaceae bacterium H3SJ34-1]|uniref:anti-phage dCTP deaminase n=1 Tax=Terripilifer ovatus TaxID=3032367 RepID=UPI003AB9936A|nr:anti-phage dCTP deaminase [Roseiarcaceae bacterium H3SJ34-1]
MVTKQTSKVRGNGSRSARVPTPIDDPELVFGIVGPIGVNLDAVIDALWKNLDEVGYKSSLIHLTDLMRVPSIRLRIDDSSYYNRYRTLISYANAFRAKAGNPAAMAGLAILKIMDLRSGINGLNRVAVDSSEGVEPALGSAFIVRQFKRSEEIELMRSVYGRKFIQISVFGSSVDRRKVIMEKIAKYSSGSISDAERETQAIDLIDMDRNQQDDSNGQRLEEVFHLGDVFVDGISKERCEITMRRFIRALFGDNSISPSRDEYGLYTATAAALRSNDLSRQVGAAIFTKQGEIISMGCNEVPKAGGGTYWGEDGPDIHRDFERGSDANQDRKIEIALDLLERMDKAKLLAKAGRKPAAQQAWVKKLIKNAAVDDAQIMDIIEFGRMVHAEMNAVTDAARLGRSTQSSTLFCTTFPCHMCAKHIVASGIDRVVFLEPYPKSYAQKLHDDSITFESGAANKVSFEPFIGISPRRYRDIFEKRKKRKDDRGKPRDWYEARAIPRIEDKTAAYIENEEPAVLATLYKIRRRLNRF